MRHPFRRHRWTVVSTDWTGPFSQFPSTEVVALCRCKKVKTVVFDGANLTIAAAQLAFPKRSWL